MTTERKWWLDEPRNRDKIYYFLIAACVASIVADFFYEKHGEFAAEHWFGFHAAFGFAACVALILLAKQLRKWVMRREDYYDR